MENNKAWAVLLEDEKSALTLSISYHKSTWEAGEIMDKAHYKYLEIKSRAERFVRIFTEYFQDADSFIPPNSFLHKDFQEYIHSVMIQRKSRKETSDNNKNSMLFVEQSRDRLILEQMELLKKTKDPKHQQLYQLITEFDRWNNFRILPKEIQEPSAFKRRNKTRNLKHLKKVTTIPTFSVNRLISRYDYKGKYKKLFAPIVTEISDDGYIVMTVEDKPIVVEELSSIGLFIFADEDDALDFGALLYNYISKGKKTCKEGQRFWPKYRVLTEKALNWKSVNNIVPMRKYLQNAFDDLHLIDKPKRDSTIKLKTKPTGLKMSKSEVFYDK